MIENGLDSTPTFAKIGFVLNPTKPHAESSILGVIEYFTKHNLPDPIFKLTYGDSTGYLQAKDLVSEGCEVVVAMGGDGTVRAVAKGLIGTNIPMGIIAIGTANLLAKNFNLPIRDVDASLDIILRSKTKTIDVGYVVKLQPDQPGRNLFLVLAGFGLDAKMICDTSDRLKVKFGSMAYILAIIRNIFTTSHTYNVQIDANASNSDNGCAEADSKTFTHELTNNFKTVMVSNSRNILRFPLFPAAKYDDGKLDVLAVQNRFGIFGWISAACKVFFRVKNHKITKLSSVITAQAKYIRISCQHDLYLHCDGESFGKCRRIKVKIMPKSLKIVY